MYVDDGDLIDIAAKDSSQARIGKMSRLMGAELSAKKRHLMASIGGPSGACTQFVVHDTAAACDFLVAFGPHRRDPSDPGRNPCAADLHTGYCLQASRRSDLRGMGMLAGSIKLLLPCSGNGNIWTPRLGIIAA